MSKISGHINFANEIVENIPKIIQILYIPIAPDPYNESRLSNCLLGLDNNGKVYYAEEISASSINKNNTNRIRKWHIFIDNIELN